MTCVTPVPCWALTLALACMAGFLLPAWCPHALSTQQLRSCFRIQATQPAVLKVSMTAVTCLPLWPTSSSIVRSLIDHASPSCSSAMLASCVPAPGPLHRLLLELSPLRCPHGPFSCFLIYPCLNDPQRILTPVILRGFLPSSFLSPPPCS